MRRLLGLLALILVAVLANGAGATDGKALLYGGGGEGRVIFDGQLHAAKGYVCNDCHLTLFPTQRKGLITFADHKTGGQCFACHNGKVAFKTCSGCHRDISEPVVQAKPAAAVLNAPLPAAIVPLTYEGATTIGTKILPEAAALFTQRTGVPFGAIGGAGASAGFKAVQEGRAALGGLANAMTEEQKAQIAASKIIGYDVMGVFVHPGNPLRSLTRSQLKEIFSGRATNWRQVGGPDRPITIYSEKLAGGRATVKAFQDMVLGQEAYGPIKELDDATDCIEELEKDVGGIAASSMSFATPHVSALAVDGAPPSRDAVQNGSYPLKRPLILVSRQNTGDVKTFFDFMLSAEAQAIVGKNFVPVK